MLPSLLSIEYNNKSMFEGSNRADEDLDNINAALQVLSKKWQPLILYLLLSKGSMNFSELKEELDDISGKVLSQNLEKLGENDLVSKEIVSESPKRVKYSSTSKSRDMKSVLDLLEEWGQNYSEGEEYNIVVVDDEEKLAEMYGRWLKGRFDVEVANSGEDALEEIDKETDLVILDRIMPGMSGKRTAEIIRDQLDCYIVFLTAKNPEIDIAELEIDDYLVKPVDKTELMEKIEEVLSRGFKDSLKRKMEALSSKKEILENEFTETELEQYESYRDLSRKLRRLRDKE